MLRELFEKWAAQKHISRASYALMEALVEAVEPPTCGDCGCFQQKACPIWYAVEGGLVCKLFQANVPIPAVEPGDIDATIRKRRKVCNHQLRKELAEAKAEIERLRSFAENWQLVLRMRPGSSLTRGSGGGPYWTDINQAGTNIGVAVDIDPAEALRSIQEVGDDEA